MQPDGAAPDSGRSGIGPAAPGGPKPARPLRVEVLPRDGSLDATFAFLRDGYRFVGRRCDRLDSDAFRTRILLRQVVCFRGARWSRLFYGAEGLTRVGAMPAPVLHLLQDAGSVQQLEGPAHQARKAMFVDLLLDEERVAALAAQFRRLWLEALPDWQRRGRVCLLVEVSRLLSAAALDWAGVDLGPRERSRAATTLFQMVDQAGRPRIATLGALAARRGLERQLGVVVDAAREDGARPGSPLAAVAAARDADGRLLTREVAAVELLNLLRPIVAVGRYIAFVALTLHQVPEWRERFSGGSDDQLEPFCEEVRRRAPFFPVTAAIARHELVWEGLRIPAGRWLLFDLYGTLHDPAEFPEPDAFRPDRCLSWRDDDDRFVPQGAGDVRRTHRCPGERATVALMVEALKILCRNTRYRVPDQDLRVRLDRIPAQPASGLVVDEVVPLG